MIRNILWFHLDVANHRPEISRLVEYIGCLLEGLHNVLHDQRLIAFDCKVQSFHLHEDLEEFQELWSAMLVLRGQQNNPLDLTGIHLQTGGLVPDKQL